jgi:hypothetical protein
MEPRRRISQSHVTAISCPASKSILALRYEEEAQEKTKSVPNSTSMTSIGRSPRPSRWKEMESGNCKVASLTVASKSARTGAIVGAGLGAGVGAGVDVGVEVGVNVGATVGVEVGVNVGATVGVEVGVNVGATVRVEVGVNVGATVSSGESQASSPTAMAVARTADAKKRIIAQAQWIYSEVAVR